MTTETLIKENVSLRWLTKHHDHHGREHDDMQADTVLKK